MALVNLLTCQLSVVCSSHQKYNFYTPLLPFSFLFLKKYFPSFLFLLTILRRVNLQKHYVKYFQLCFTTITFTGFSLGFFASKAVKAGEPG